MGDGLKSMEKISSNTCESSLVGAAVTQLIQLNSAAHTVMVVSIMASESPLCLRLLASYKAQISVLLLPAWILNLAGIESSISL